MLLSAFFIFSAVSSAQAGRISLNSHTDTFVNSDCALNDTCDLKGFSLMQENYQLNLTIGGQERKSYGTRMILNYDTASLSTLEKYGVVQFIRGCQFSSEVKNGKVEKALAYTYERDGGDIPYIFPEWEIDGFVDDPLEWGTQKSAGSRHSHYWIHDPGKNSAQKSDMYGFQKPSTARLWQRDLPGAAQFFPDGAAYAHNISLQFKTCIYKTADVPRSVPYAQIDFAEPVHCFEWSSSFIYNHGLGKFESPSEIDPFCSEQH